MLPGPCMPQPTTPTTMRSEGAALPSRPKALAGMMVGAARARLVAARNRRRLIPELKEDSFMGLYDARTPAPRCQKKMSGGPADLARRSRDRSGSGSSSTNGVADADGARADDFGEDALAVVHHQSAQALANGIHLGARVARGIESAARRCRFQPRGPAAK